MKTLHNATQEFIAGKTPEELITKEHLAYIRKNIGRNAPSIFKNEYTVKAKLHKKEFNPPLTTEEL